jgi:hypothetical protein
MSNSDTQNDDRVFIVDTIDARPGEAKKVRDAYRSEYVPGARERGMTLLHEWISPPILMDERSLRLTFIWSVPDVDGWWSMRLTTSSDISAHEFWQRLEPLIEKRERRFHQGASLHV